MIRATVLCQVVAGALVATAGLCSEPGPQSPAAGAILRVEGDVAHPLALSRAELRQLARQTVAARAHDGKESRYEGVPVAELLRKAGVPTGKELRGKALTLHVIVEAADGYRVLFALPELDPAFSDRMILLADMRDGGELSSKEGPLQIVVPGEKRHARWVRQVIRLRIGQS
jgi:hypothetical protein